MLVLKKDLWEKDKILTVVSTNQWSEADATLISDCVLADMEKLLLDCKNTNVKCILLLDCNKGEIPPMTYIFKTMKFLLSIKSLIKETVYFSAIYDKNDSAASFVKTVLKIYQPVRPLFTINSKTQLVQLCTDKEIVDFSYKI